MVVFTLCTPLQSNFLVLSELRRGLFTIRLSSAMYIPRRLCRAWIRYFLLLPIYIDAFSLAPLLPVYIPGFCRWLFPPSPYTVAKYKLLFLGFVVDCIFSGGAAGDFILTPHCCATVLWFSFPLRPGAIIFPGGADG
jgi:hypothetical protein